MKRFGKCCSLLFPPAIVLCVGFVITARAQNTFPNSGNVGIGTTSPTVPLQVNVSSPTAEATAVVASGGGADRFALNVNVNGGGWSLFDYGSAGNGWNRGITQVNGNVGIGTTTPTERLEINRNQNAGTALVVDNGYTSPGNAAYSGFWFRQSGANRFFFGAVNDGNTTQTGGPGAVQLWNFANGPMLFSTNNNERLRITSSGNVGIGTTSPTAKLHVSGSGNMQAIVESTTAAAELDLVSNAAGSGKWALGTGWSSAGSIRNLWFYDNVAAAIRLTIDSSGNVGIGKSNPTVALDVQGDIKASGTIFAKYQDLAEWVPSSEQLSAGTVVVLDTTKSNQVISSTVSYDTRVAGVISAQPGITLGESGEGKVLVATTGRVRVKVDASRGAIQIGDLLVTSDVAGVAMKSEAVNLGGIQIHRPGTIIGKALEPLAKSSGEILVLLSLQ